MVNINFLAAEIFGIEAMLYTASFFSTAVFTILFLIYLWFVQREKEIIYYIVPVLFLLRIFFSVNFSEIKEDEILKIKTNIVNERGTAEKINDRFSLRTVHLNMENTADGKYIIFSRLHKIKEDYNIYEAEIINKKEVSPNIMEKFFESRLNSMKENLSNKCGNFLQGVILGERRYIYRDVAEGFRYSGSAHLLAISGLHIGIIIGLIIYFTEFLKIKREMRYSIVFLFLSVYILGISISPSVIRSYIMGAVFIFGKIFYEQTDIRKSFSLAVLINLFIYPNSLGNISFVLSYLCLFSIIYIYPKCRLKKKPEKNKNKINNDKMKIKLKNFADYMIFTGVIQIFLIPVNIYFFKNIPLLSYFTNMMIVPFGTVFITLGFISFFIPKIIFGFFVAPVLEIFYFIIEEMILFFGKIPFLTLNLEKKFDLKFIVFLYIILFVVFYGKDIKKKFLK